MSAWRSGFEVTFTLQESLMMRSSSSIQVWYLFQSSGDNEMNPFMLSAGTSRENSTESDQTQILLRDADENTQNSVRGALGTDPQLVARAANERLKASQ